jgi:hypothetical protein
MADCVDNKTTSLSNFQSAFEYERKKSSVIAELCNNSPKDNGSQALSLNFEQDPIGLNKYRSGPSFGQLGGIIPTIWDSDP